MMKGSKLYSMFSWCRCGCTDLNCRLNREAVDDVEICGVTIKKGMDITVSPLALHYLPEYWPKPEKFDPERYKQN